MTDLQSLPGGVFCITLSHSLDDAGVMERYLEQYPTETERCIPIALRDMLSPGAEELGFSPMKIPSKDDTLRMLHIIWTLYSDGPNVPLPKLRSLFWLACSHGLTYLVPYIVSYVDDKTSEHQGIVNLVNFNHEALTAAVESGNADTVRMILTLGANVDSRNYALTSLRAYNPEIIDLLLAPTKMALPGIDQETLPLLNGVEAQGELIESYALRMNLPLSEKDKIIKHLISRGANIGGASTLENVIESTTDLNIIRMLVENKADIHASNDGVLATAAAKGDDDIVRYLLDLKANVNENTSLTVAASNNHTSTVKLLLAARADIHANNDEALRDSVTESAAESVRVLIDARADIDVITPEDLDQASGAVRRIFREYGRYAADEEDEFARWTH